MLDAHIRPLIDPLLDTAGRWLAARGATADGLTLAGFGCGLAGALSIVGGFFPLALALVAANRIFDGLDGAVARATTKTDRGGFLDITLDFIIYAAVPLAFAVHDPATNALAAATVLASFLANGATFLGFAIMAERRGLQTRAQGAKSLYYMMGLAGGTETVLVFIAMCLWPQGFVPLAFGFAALCVLSATSRLLFAWRALA